jgi:hypothetical protein
MRCWRTLRASARDAIFNKRGCVAVMRLLPPGVAAKRPAPLRRL